MGVTILQFRTATFPGYLWASLAAWLQASQWFKQQRLCPSTPTSDNALVTPAGCRQSHLPEECLGLLINRLYDVLLVQVSHYNSTWYSCVCIVNIESAPSIQFIGRLIIDSQQSVCSASCLVQSESPVQQCASYRISYGSNVRLAI
jgi:hypothetical protein